MKILHYLHDKKKLPVYLLFFLYIGHNTKYTMNTHNHVFLGGVVELILGKGGGAVGQLHLDNGRKTMTFKL